MEKDTKHGIIAVLAVVVIIAVIFFGISTASGVSPPQTIVESGSMQHGTGSQFGIIDTGDMIVLKEKDGQDVVSYVEGYSKGYRTFGDYGDVIIYDRGPNLNPVIHRAMLWLESNNDGTWKAQGLSDYPDDLWYCPGTDDPDPNQLSGTLILKDVGYRDDVDASINLDRLFEMGSESGFLTMGDNNSGFDQPSNVPGVNGLISYEQIRSVAWFEIPWVGALKMMINGKTADLDRWVPNTIPCLAAAIIMILFLIIGISFLFDQRYYGKYRKELSEEMNAPTPIFPVEEEID